MARWAALLLASGLLAGPAADEKQPSAEQTPAAAPQQQEQEPPEEDVNLSVKEYDFNPLQASKEIQIGNFYYKKGSYRAAAQRFREATRWDPGHAQAWRKLGEAAEKTKDAKAAREAFLKFLELDPESKEAPEIRRKLKIRK